jgi:uncharacterized membrane protein (UPF0182 family)
MRVRGTLVALIVLGFVLLSLGSQLLGLYVDWLWFHEVRYAAVFLTVLRTQLWLGAATALAVFLILAPNVFLALRLVPRDALIVVDDALGLPSPEVLIPFLRRLAMPVCVLVSAVAGWMGAGRWILVLQAQHATSFHLPDPLFGRDVSFYIFQLPLWNSLYAWLWGVLLFTGLATVGLYLCTRGIGLGARGLRVAPATRGHLLALGALLLGLKAVGYWLARFDLLLTQRGVVFGAGYTDVHVQLPVLTALTALTGALALVCLATIRLRTWRPLLGGLGALAAVAILGGVVYPDVIQRYQVVPNEIDKERPYIDFNIRYTRLAYGLNNIQEREFPSNQTLTLEDLRNNQATIQNIRLWDTRPLLATYGQLQEIRTYYTFRNIDIDRYKINGQYRQVTLAARDISVQNLPSRNWINERLTYTHGYGAVVSPVNRVTAEGLPEFWVKNIPPVSTTDLKIANPALYYSEGATDYVFAKTRAKEFDYPAGDQNAYTTYAGAGGISLDSFARKALIAAYLGDVKLLLSSDVTPESRVLLHRTIRERIQRIAPFFRYDPDPYLVISAAGRLVWFLDGYTVADGYPYATPTPGLGNYVRNAVKVTVDAYDGTVHFYLADPTDPLVQTISRIFPGLLEPLSAMPADLQAHVRYPEGLFRVQAAMYATYHMQDTQVFYNKEDLWSVPVRRVGGEAQAMEPYYTILRLPGEPKEEFVLLLPFTPSKKDNLAAWLAARSDPPNYGKLVVYTFPKQSLVYGPRQMEARIDQEPTISQQLTLWNQRGSQVIRGNLLVIPIHRSLLYIEPLYIAAETGQLPELKRVILGLGDRIVMDPTLEGAIERVFSGAQAGPPTPAIAAASAPSAGTASSTKALLDAAAAAAGRASEELQRLGAILRQLQGAGTH